MKSTLEKNTFYLTCISEIQLVSIQLIAFDKENLINFIVLYAVSHIFLIIFVQEENNIKFARDSGDEDIILTHENALYGSLIISACGSFFINLALFRLLEVWIRVGQKKKTFSHLPRGFVTLSVVILSLIPVAFSVAGDALLIIESSKEEEMSVQVRKALVLKIIGAACNVVLVIFYLALCVIYSWSAYICNTVEKAIKYRHTAPVGEKGKEASPEVDHPLRKPKRTFRKVVIMLMALGVLVLIRFLYNLYIVLMVLLSGPIWDIYAYLILVVADGLIFLVTAYCSSLSNVKAPIIVSVSNY
jgi:hypothetical protein